MLTLEHLRVSYRTRTTSLLAVNDLCLDIQQGECVALVGESGCGKTTVALAIMRYLSAQGHIDHGRIVFQGRDLLRLPARSMRRIRGAGIAMVYQDPASALNPSLTLGVQLGEVLRYHTGERGHRAVRRVHQVLADLQLTEVERLLAAYPHQLSGGQQQRLVLAMALLARPALLVLDEPTTALDATVAASLTALLQALRRTSGVSMLFISHDLRRVQEICDRVYVMYAGQIVEAGPVTGVFTTPRHPYTRGLLRALPGPDKQRQTRPLQAIHGQAPLLSAPPCACTFGPRCGAFQSGICDAGVPALYDVAPVPERHQVRCPRWHELPPETVTATALPAAPPAPGREILRVTGLQKRYPLSRRLLSPVSGGSGRPYVRALESISLTVRAGEIVALVGESGSGKSTVARIVTGLETATAGTVLLYGHDVARQPVTRRTPEQRRAVQMMFQHPQETLNPSLTIGYQIGRALKHAGLAHDRQSRDRLVQRLLERVQLPPSLAWQRPQQLSGGQQQRVALARAFAGPPALVVADEPVTALDISVQAAVLELLLDMQRTYGTAMLFISHDLSVVRYLADRVIVMYRGQMMEYGPAEAVLTPPSHPYTEALLSAMPGAGDGALQAQPVVAGEVSSLLEPLPGCPFVTRCPRRLGWQCEETPPPQQRVTPEHVIACHIPLEHLSRGDPFLHE